MTDPSHPSLRWLTAPDEVSADLRAQLVASWRDVVNDGGAVGSGEEAPVSDDVVAPVVTQMVAGLDAPLGRLLVATRGAALVGWLLLTGSADPVTAHWGRVTRLQTSPSARGTGVGAWPRALRFTRYGVRDEVLMALDLRG